MKGSSESREYKIKLWQKLARECSISVCHICRRRSENKHKNQFKFLRNGSWC